MISTNSLCCVKIQYNWRFLTINKEWESIRCYFFGQIKRLTPWISQNKEKSTVIFNKWPTFCKSKTLLAVFWLYFIRNIHPKHFQTFFMHVICHVFYWQFFLSEKIADFNRFAWIDGQSSHIWKVCMAYWNQNVKIPHSKINSNMFQHWKVTQTSTVSIILSFINERWALTFVSINAFCAQISCFLPIKVLIRPVLVIIWAWFLVGWTIETLWSCTLSFYLITWKNGIFIDFLFNYYVITIN